MKIWEHARKFWKSANAKLQKGIDRAIDGSVGRIHRMHLLLKNQWRRWRKKDEAASIVLPQDASTTPPDTKQPKDAGILVLLAAIAGVILLAGMFWESVGRPKGNSTAWNNPQTKEEAKPEIQKPSPVPPSASTATSQPSVPTINQAIPVQPSTTTTVTDQAQYSGPMPPPSTMIDEAGTLHKKEAQPDVVTVAQKTTEVKAKVEVSAAISRTNPVVKELGGLRYQMYGCQHLFEAYVECEGDVANVGPEDHVLSFKEGGLANYFGADQHGRHYGDESHIRLLGDVTFGANNWTATLFSQGVPGNFTIKFPDKTNGLARVADIKLHLRVDKTYGDVEFKHVTVN